MRESLRYVIYDRVYKNPRLFVGVTVAGTVREVFRSTCPKETHPHYDFVVGPFITKRGADWFAAYGIGNPHVHNVDVAEQIAQDHQGVFGEWVRDQGYSVTLEGRVTSPGKFESEPFATVIFWDKVMNGFQDESLYSYQEDGKPYDVFHVDAEDRRNFHLPTHTRHVVIYQDDVGFVTMLCFDDEDYAKFADRIEDDNCAESLWDDCVPTEETEDSDAPA